MAGQRPKSDDAISVHLTEGLLAHLLNQTPVLSFIKDDEGRYLYASRNFYQFFRVRAEDVIDKTDFDFLPMEIAKQFTDNDNVVRNEGIALETIESVPFENKEIRSLVHKFPLPGPDGKRYVGGTTIDITDRIEAQELGAKLAAIVDFSHDAIIGATTGGIINSWNKSAERIFGYSCADILGNRFDMLVPNEAEKAELAELFQSLQEVDGHEIVFRTKHGHRLDVSITISMIRDDDAIIGTSIIARDITGKKETEEKLKRAAVELSSARDQALEASNLKSAFVANISHELRTPLTGITGIVELLSATKLDDYQIALIKLLEESADSLLTIVNDILDLSKIEAGKVVIEKAPFNLLFLVQECARLLAATIKGNDVVLRTSIDHRIPEFIIGDAERIRQVLTNLLANAIKFTDSGFVEVFTLLDGQDEKTVTVKLIVKDSGIGISEKEQRLLFLPFTQVDGSTTRKYSGTGLGLSISKQLVETMGGTIGVTSVKGEGTEFWCKISFAKCLNESPVEDYSRNQENKYDDSYRNKQVLLVEDNPLLRKLVLQQLSNIGIEAFAVTNGLEAVEAVKANAFDVILMDCQLPAMDGFEATRIIRKLEADLNRYTPIIALTAGAMMGDRERCLEHGMDDYMSKPVSLATLREKLLQWMELKQSRQS